LGLDDESWIHPPQPLLGYCECHGDRRVGQRCRPIAGGAIRGTHRTRHGKRRGVGLRGHDPDRAFAGFTLFSPLPSKNKTVYLIDMQGNVVHTWEMPYPPGQSGYNGQIPNESHVGRAPYRGGSAVEITWDGRILWEVTHPDHNHDGIRLRNGNVMLICQKPLTGEIAAKVRGGRPGTEYDNGKMDAPYLIEMTRGVRRAQRG
jgi:hypothetical protein